LIYFGSGSSIVAAKVVQAVFGGGTCGVTYFLGRRVFSHGAGVVAGIITALYGPLIFFDGELVGAGWASFWAVSMTLLLIRAKDRATVGRLFALGLCGGFGVVTRPPLLPFLVVVSFWLVFRLVRDPNRTVRLRRGVPAGVLGFGLVVLPVAGVQHRVMGRFSFVPNSGGINFYIGNNANRCETLKIRPGPDWEWLTQMPAREGAPGQEAGSVYFFEKVGAYARESSLAFAGGLAQKVWQFWSSRELPRNVDLYLFREWSWVLRGLIWKVGGFGFPFGVLWPMALIGVMMNFRRIPVPVYLAMALYSAAIALVFVSARYRVVIVPVMAVLAGQGLLELATLFRQGRFGRLGLMFGIGLIAAVMSSIPSAYCVEDDSFAAEMRGYLGSELSRRGRSAEAAAALVESLRLDPENASVHFSIGTLLKRRGQSDEALDHLEAAVDRKPFYRKARAALGEILMERGQTGEAASLYEEGIRIDATDAASHRGLGAILAGQGKLEEAAGHYRESLEYERRLSETFVELAEVLRRLGRIEAAAACLREGVAFHPRSEALLKRLGDLYADSGRASEAVETYRLALGLRSDWWEVANRLAWLLATSEEDRVRDSREAIRLSLLACNATVYGEPAYLDTLSAAYAEARRFDEAILTAQRAIDRAAASGEDRLAEAIRERLTLYSERKPYRQKNSK
jgi:tetratricopeptide (TPR) repeat protein